MVLGRQVPAMADVAAYMAAGAVLPTDQSVSPILLAKTSAKEMGKPVFKRKESRRRRLARHGHWVRFQGRYLDIGQYYISEAKPCGLVYLYEQKGEQYRYRGIGCGDRTWCPVCCCYHRDKLAADAAGDMLAAIQGLEIAADVTPRDFGTKVIPTLPKETSAWIDTSADRWDKIVLVRKAAAAWAGDMWPGCTAVVGLDEAVFWSNPLKYPQQLRHFLRYLYRSPLYDLWKGWDKVDSLGCVHYKFWKAGELERVYTKDEIGVALERVASTPRKWKRVVWFGAFSDGQKTKTMASLGLEKVAKPDEEEEGWRQVGEPLRFKRFLPWKDGGGIVLVDKAGVEVVVPEGVINYGPSGVTLGRRIRYEPPGGS